MANEEEKQQVTEDVKKEILATLEYQIINEVNAMIGDYTVAEIASEVLLNHCRGQG